MAKLMGIIAILSLVFFSCNNNENAPAKAGTSDSAGVGHQRGKGTPYRGDSATKRLQSDTVSNK